VGVLLAGRTVTSKADQFMEYAEEAMRWATQAETAETKQAMLDLARIWTQAALESGIAVAKSRPPEHSALAN
jgi:isopentenyl phosphate kinase